nr:MAG TPA: hypothetical protein [Caudoviricetes sp.]
MWWRDIVGAADIGSIVTAAGWLAVAALTAAEKLAPRGKKPWSALARALGHEMTRDMREHMDGVDKRLSQLSDKLDDVKAFGEETRAIAAPPPPPPSRAAAAPPRRARRGGCAPASI